MAPEGEIHLKIDLTDEKSFEFVFRTYYEQLANFANKYVGDPDLAEEIVQEVFAYIWQKGEEIEVKTNPKSYLYGSVRNYCLNHIKHQKVKQTYIDRTLHASRNDNDAVDLLELDELESHIREAVDKLPAKCREIFELNRFEQKKYKEIADELNISIKTVENQMGKALKHMRNELKDFLVIIILLLMK